MCEKNEDFLIPFTWSTSVRKSFDAFATTLLFRDDESLTDDLWAVIDRCNCNWTRGGFFKKNCSIMLSHDFVKSLDSKLLSLYRRTTKSQRSVLFGKKVFSSITNKKNFLLHHWSNSFPPIPRRIKKKKKKGLLPGPTPAGTNSVSYSLRRKYISLRVEFAYALPRVFAPNIFEIRITFQNLLRTLFDAVTWNLTICQF